MRAVAAIRTADENPSDKEVLALGTDRNDLSGAGDNSGWALVLWKLPGSAATSHSISHL